VHDYLKVFQEILVQNSYTVFILPLANI